VCIDHVEEHTVRLALDILASPLFALAEEPVPAVGEAAPRR
jgi:hypothetical protein